MPEILNRKIKFINRNFKHLSIEELAVKTGIKPNVIRSLIDQYRAEMLGKDQSTQIKKRKGISLSWKTILLISLLFAVRTYERASVWQEPLSLWTDAVKKSPYKARPHNNLGMVYHKKGMVDEAISEYKKALTINPNLADVHLSLGDIYDEKGRLDKAISEYKRALVIVPNLAEAHYNLGNAYHKKGELDKAINEYKRAIAIKSDYANAHNSLAFAYYYKENYKFAIIHYDKAVELGGSVNPKLLELLKQYR